MPNRILREGILTSHRIAKLSWPAEVFYRRLHSVVDDFGRYHADPMLLRAGCYPRQLDKVSDSDIGKWIRETVEAGLVRGYEHDEQRYLEVLDFRQQARAKKSKFPDPPSGDAQTHIVCVADAQQMNTQAEAYSDSYSKAKADSERASPTGSRLTLTELPEDWRLYCQTERPDLQASTVWVNFHDYWTAKAGKDARKVDWLATWRSWVRKERGVAPNKQTALEERNREVARQAAAEFKEANRANL